MRQSLIGLVVVGVVVVVSIWIATARHAALRPPPGPLFLVGKDTTALTTPLLPNGRPDYIAALNARLSVGVTADNNAFIPLLKIVGLALLPAKQGAEICRLLGVEMPPAQGAYFVRESQGLKNANKGEEIGAAFTGPWTAEQYPHIAEWLKENQASLDALAEAVARPHLYFPQISNDPGTPMLGLTGAGYHVYGDLLHAVTADAQLNLTTKQMAVFETRIISAVRLARLVQQSGREFDGIVGATFERHGYEAILRALKDEGLSADACRRMLDAIQRLPMAFSQAEVWNMARRWTLLDSMLSLAEKAATPGAFGKGISADAAHIDWNVVLRRINVREDQWVAMFAVATWPETLKAGADLEAELQKINVNMEARKTTWFQFTLSDTIQSYSERVADYFLAGTAKIFLAQWELQRQAVLLHGGAQVCLALVIYKDKHGAFPESLAALVDETLIDQIPIDFYSGKPVIYRRVGESYLLYGVGADGVDDGGKAAKAAKDFVIYPPP